MPNAGIAKAAATGAATGAPAGPEGAAAGAAVGAAGSKVQAKQAKRAEKTGAQPPGESRPDEGKGDAHKKSGPPDGKSRPPSSGRKMSPTTARWSGKGSNPRRMLVGEFIVCSIILALSPLSAKHKDDDAVKWLQRGGSISLLFLVFGIMATLSDRAGRVAAAMGLTITVGLLVSDADVFQNFLSGLQAPVRKTDGIPPGTGDTNLTPDTPPDAVGGVGGGQPFAGLDPLQSGSNFDPLAS